MKEISIASDHAGFELKEYIKEQLAQEGYLFQDYGTFSSESMDYPDVIHPLAADINAGKHKRGIIICGSGNGVNMVANKYLHIRSALCWTPEIAVLARQHNDANIVALPARFISKQTALDIVHSFLQTDFEAGRHCRRVEKISCLK